MTMQTSADSIDSSRELGLDASAAPRVWVCINAHESLIGQLRAPSLCPICKSPFLKPVFT